MAARNRRRKSPRKENDSNADRSGPAPRPGLQKFLHGRSQQYFCAALCNESSRLWWSIHPAKTPEYENRAMDTGDPAATNAQLLFPYAAPGKRRFSHWTRVKEPAGWLKCFPPCVASGTRSSKESGESAAPARRSSPLRPG